MKQYLTPKRLFFTTIGVTVLLLMLTYGASVQRTLDARAEVTRLEQENAELIRFKRVSSDTLSHIQRQLLANATQSNQQVLLDYLTRTCGSIRSLQVNGVYEPHRYEDGSMAIETYAFQVKGPYHRTLHLLDSIHRETPGMLKSVTFERIKPTYNAKPELHTTLYFQQVDQ